MVTQMANPMAENRQRRQSGQSETTAKLSMGDECPIKKNLITPYLGFWKKNISQMVVKDGNDESEWDPNPLKKTPTTTRAAKLPLPSPSQANITKPSWTNMSPKLSVP